MLSRPVYSYTIPTIYIFISITNPHGYATFYKFYHKILQFMIKCIVMQNLRWLKDILVV